MVKNWMKGLSYCVEILVEINHVELYCLKINESYFV